MDGLQERYGNAFLASALMGGEDRLGECALAPAAADGGDRTSGGGVQLLVGGPYTDASGRLHRYGHTALRVFDGTGQRDTTYDFGRYGETRGRFSAEGEGVLRAWDGDPGEYLAGQNALGRVTTGHTFPASPEEVARAFALYDALIAEGSPHAGDRPGDGRRDVRLARDYHGIDHNCTTLSIDGFEAARPDIDLDVPGESQGRGMNAAERLAATGIEGWNDEIFMPADLGVVLDGLTSDEVLVERWDPTGATPYEVLADPGLTCAQPTVGGG